VDRDKIIRELEDCLDDAKTTERKVRLNYLIAKIYASMNNSWAIGYFADSCELLEYAGENGIMGFRNFYRYRDKLDKLEFYIEQMMVEI